MVRIIHTIFCSFILFPCQQAILSSGHKLNQILLRLLFRIVTRYLARSLIIVTAYSLPVPDLGRRPIVSIITI